MEYPKRTPVMFDLMQCDCGNWCQAEGDRPACTSCQQTAEIQPYQDVALQIRAEFDDHYLDDEPGFGRTHYCGLAVDITI